MTDFLLGGEDTGRVDEEPNTVFHREPERRAPRAIRSNTPARRVEVAK